MSRPKTEIYYQWKEFKTVEGETKPRLLTPWANPDEYEFSFNSLYDTPEEAEQDLINYDIDPEESKNWVLVKVTFKPVKRN